MNLRLAVFVLAFSSAAGWLCASEDERPVVDASKIAAEKIADAALPTFHIVGDSTVRSGGAGAGLWGWGAAGGWDRRLCRQRADIFHRRPLAKGRGLAQAR